MAEIIYTFSNGEQLVRDLRTQSLSVRFLAPKKVLSTSLLNGGYREDLTAVFNYTCGGPNTCMSLKAFEAHLAREAAAMGLDPQHTTGVGTAALMKNVAVVTETYEALTVTACVTAGVEGNAGCAGDPAFYYGGEDREILCPGTINILLFLGADMPPGVLSRAMVTAVEAKSAALRELLVGSRYSEEPATGTGTDSMILVSDPSAPVYFRGAGKHNKLGELIGKTVKQAVKEALRRQNGLDGTMTRNVLYRLRRYGVTWESLEALAKTRHERLFEEAKVRLTDIHLVTWATLYAHILDECRWGLMPAEEARYLGGEILRSMAEETEIPAVPIRTEGIPGMLEAFGIALIRRITRPPAEKTMDQ